MGVSPSGGIAMVSRTRELEEAMRIILLTYPGERPMRPEFGSRVRDFVFRNADYDTATQLSIEVRNALVRWEPRVDIVSVNVYPDLESRDRLLIDIEYVIKAENDRRNLVFPFYTIPDDGSDY
jgi:phage baseplate assembly protein W